MGTQKLTLLTLGFIALLAGQSLPAFGQSQTIVPFDLPPIPPKENQAPPSVPVVKNVDTLNDLNPDVAFVPIDQAISNGRKYFNGVVLVAKDSKIIFEHSYDPTKIGQKYSDDDINRQFLLGSMTKQFTAALILKLVDRGVINLDDSIQKYFPGTPGWANIKIRNLLNHTSGFTYEYLSYHHPCPFRSEDQALARLKRISPTYAPGENFKYMNMNYFLLGKIVEKYYGGNMAWVIQSEITGPLSMDLTKVLDKNACHFGVGNMSSSPRDLLKWENALFNDKSVLSEATFKEMVSPDVSTHHFYPTLESTGKRKVVVDVPDSYGLGIRIQEVDGETIYWHSGHVSTYTALFEYYPRRKETVVVLAYKKDEKVFDIARDAINAVFDLPTVPEPLDKSRVIRTSSKHKGAKSRGKQKLTASNRAPSNPGF